MALKNLPQEDMATVTRTSQDWTPRRTQHPLGGQEHVTRISLSGAPDTAN